MNTAQEFLEILETMNDEAKAAHYLNEFNRLSKEHHRWLMNREKSLDHKIWKQNCDQSQRQLEDFVELVIEESKN